MDNKNKTELIKDFTEPEKFNDIVNNADTTLVVFTSRVGCNHCNIQRRMITGNEIFLRRRYNDSIQIVFTDILVKQNGEFFKEFIDTHTIEPEKQIIPMNVFYKEGELKEIIPGALSRDSLFTKLDSYTNTKCGLICRVARRLGFY